MLSEYVDPYLKDHETAWAPSTRASETSRLRRTLFLIDKGPGALFEHVVAEGYKPYAIKTLFIRICRLEAWVNKSAEYRTWYKKHSNRFKHAYVKRELNLTYSEVGVRVARLAEPYRTQALEMLKTGLRISEVPKARDGMVIGKGDKPRKVFGRITVSAPKSTFQAKLKAVGLTPHMLRKLCATKLAEKGATPADLCAVFGWSSITTAYQYLQPQSEERLQRLMEP
jgi:hypothetical protein